MEPLKFGDRECPIDLGFRSFSNRKQQFPELGFRGTSHANKDATTIHAQLYYLGAHGAELEDFTATFTGTYDGMTLGPALRAGTEASLTTTGFFMPENATGVRALVVRVEFIDGTVWERR